MAPAPSNSPAPLTEVVFATTVRGLFHVALKEKIPPRFAQRMLEAGLDVTQPAPAQTPRAKWNTWLQIAVEELWPDLPRDQGFRKLGHLTVSGFTQTLAGKAQAAMARLLGPRRILDQIRNSLNSGCNYNQTRVEPLGDRHVRYWINETGEQHPEFFAGLLQSAVEMAGGSNVVVKLLEVGPQGATYDVTWA